MRCVCMLIAMVFVGPMLPVLAQAPSAEPYTAPGVVYDAGAYDPARDPASDLEAATARAQAEGKRILLKVGGTWCGWCHTLDRFLRADSLVAAALQQRFVVLKVNRSEENRNEPFLSGFPDIAAYPHLFVLDAAGTLVHSQGTDAMEAGYSYSREAWLTFIDTWGADE